MVLETVLSETVYGPVSKEVLCQTQISWCWVYIPHFSLSVRSSTLNEHLVLTARIELETPMLSLQEVCPLYVVNELFSLQWVLV